MDFEKRLQRAIERGQRTSTARGESAAAQALNEDELKILHGKYRLELSEHIERCLQQLADHLLGFRYASVMGEQGWGAQVSRDDVAGGHRGRATGLYTRLEVVIRPYSQVHIVELVGKATIRNKEVFHRSHYQPLAETDTDSFRERIDLWVLEFAELYTAQQ